MSKYLDLKILAGEKNFHAEDNKYRKMLYDKFYKNIDLDNRPIFTLYTLCAHENISSFSTDIDSVISEWCVTDPIRYIFDNIIKNYQSSIYSVKHDDSVDVKLKLNKRQLTHLKEIDYTIMYKTCPDFDNNFVSTPVNVKLKKLQPPENRYLTLYFRRESLNESENDIHTVQMDYFEFVLICRLMFELIKTDNYMFFDGVRFVSREPCMYPRYIHDVIPEIVYCDVSGLEFIETTSLYTNCIYFMNGGVPCFSAGSIPILGNNMLLQTDLEQSNHVHYNVSYNMTNTDDYVVHKGNLMTIAEAFKCSQYITEHTIDHVVYNTIQMYKQLTHELLQCVDC